MFAVVIGGFLLLSIAQPQLSRYISTSEIVVDEVKNETLLLSKKNELKTTTLHSSLCSRSEIRQGAWKPRRFDRLPYLAKQLDKKQCYNQTHLELPYWDSYEWKPHADCEFTQWDSNLFCSLTTNMTIAILGDSSSLEHYSSLVNILGVKNVDEEAVYREGGPDGFDLMACNNRTRLIFVRNNWLRGVGKLLLNPNLNIIILNRGAWYSPDDELLKNVEQRIIGNLRAWHQRCNETGRHCQFFWRTTVPGHPWCTNFTKPATSIDEMEAWIANLSHYLPDQQNYHWWDFARQNGLVLDLLNKSLGDLGSFYNVIDAYEINVLRPDDHVGKHGDCFHNCQPGKTMVYNQILLHYLTRQQQQPQAIARNVQNATIA